MSYDLIIGNYAYSSWSLRGWLLFDRFGLPCNLRSISFADGPVAEQIPDMAPARTVPALRTPEGAILGDSLSIAEELASRHPDRDLWPTDPRARATARALSAEMHAGFSALRSDCPMNLWQAHRDVTPRAEVLADLRRLEQIWDHARATCRPDGPWLCGGYSIADAFYAPVAARIAGYGLAVSESAQAYVTAHLHDPAFRRWRAMALAQNVTLERYKTYHSPAEWPGPAPLAARAIDSTINSGSAENAACPYSGQAATFLMETEGRVFGFCNRFCRDKTVADPEAWPQFIALLR